VTDFAGTQKRGCVACCKRKIIKAKGEKKKGKRAKGKREITCFHKHSRDLSTPGNL
jgi:hypothetical protein